MTRLLHLSEKNIIISHHDIADVWLDTLTNHHSLHAKIPFKPQDVIANFYAGTTQNTPTYLTVQTQIDTHITLSPVFLQYINHSCNPNVFFDTSTMQLICLTAIQPGDELGFFYPSTEWHMVQPFKCNCNYINCLQFISGAAFINQETLNNYRLTPFILKMLAQKNN